MEDEEGVVEQLELDDGSIASNLLSISSSRASTRTCKKWQVKIQQSLKQTSRCSLSYNQEKAREHDCGANLQLLHMI